MVKKRMGAETIVVGLTGGIASGKSTVAGEFRRRGATIIESDRISRELAMPGSAVGERIVKTFGKEIVRKDRTIDRKKLGAIVFGDPVKRKLLERITHPAIIRRIRELLRQYRAAGVPVIVLDIPLLFEAGLQGRFGKTVVVWVPEKIQARRLGARDDLSREEVACRLKAQWPLDRKRKLADYVIDNSGGRARVRGEVKKVWQVLTKAF
jgi:dephospho-CoA kinase